MLRKSTFLIQIIHPCSNLDLKSNDATATLIYSRSEVKFQLSQILYTLGGTLTSCACSRPHYSASTLPPPGEPMRECVFVMMARFVAERSRFIGQPSARLSLGSNTSTPTPTSASSPSTFSGNSSITSSSPYSMARILNGPGGPHSSSSGAPPPSILSGLGGKKNSKHMASLSLSLPLDFSYSANLTVDLGPMVGWPIEEDALLEGGKKIQYPLGVGPGVCALDAVVASNPYPNGRSHRLPSNPQASTNGHGHGHGNSHSRKNARSMTPPPKRDRSSFDRDHEHELDSHAQSHSAPPHFAAVAPLMSRNAMAAGSSPLGNGLKARKWADIVGLNDNDGPPGRVGSTALGSLPKIQTGSMVLAGSISGTGSGTGKPKKKPSVPSLLVSPASPAPSPSKRVGSSPLTPSVSTSSFAASLSSSLGLGDSGGATVKSEEQEDMDMDMDVDSIEIEEQRQPSPPHSSSEDMLVDVDVDVDVTESVMALTEEVNGDDQASGLDADGGHVMVPPWARKRVRSAPSLSARAEGSYSPSAPHVSSSDTPDPSSSTASPVPTREIKMEEDIPDGLDHIPCKFVLLVVLPGFQTRYRRAES